MHFYFNIPPILPLFLNDLVKYDTCATSHAHSSDFRFTKSPSKNHLALIIFNSQRKDNAFTDESNSA